ncbi:MAG: penicillin acylase family protein [Cyclobacteriaceae bacterium]
MKTFRFVLSLVITITLLYFLNTKRDQIPPLGKFMDPFAGFWQNGEKEGLNIGDELSLEGLDQPVTIQFDDIMVPHIFAQTDKDLFYAQGYITAYHRLWQMEFQLLATEGRISEVIGAQAVDFDKAQRRKGMAHAARLSEEQLKKDTEVHTLVKAYSDGINAFIDQIGYEDLPIEYKLLDYSPEPWTVYKTCLLLKQMSNDLSRGEMDLENTNLRGALGQETFDLLFPDRHPGIDPVISSGTPFDFDPLPAIAPDTAYPNLRIHKTLTNPNPDNGSNNFVVAGSKTNSGNPILANEPDLGLNLPSIWYVAHLNSPSYNVFGATLPGAPFVIIGFNDSISWGFTNAKRDVVDWYQVQFRDEKRDEYKYDDKWLKADQSIETIKVRDGDDVMDTIIFTHYGPVSYDRNFMGDGEQINFAMRWTAHDASDEQRTFYLLNKAKNYDEYVEAFDYYVGPPQNAAFASANGDIALWINGKFPIKWQEQGKFLLDGANSQHEWSGFIPHRQALHELNPERGFVSSANQHPADSTYPYYSYDYSYEYYRNRRINDRLKVMHNIRPEDMMTLQNDNYDYKASEALPMMLDSLDTASFTNRERVVYDLLRDWDYFAEPDRQAPAYFETWWSLLYESVWDEFDAFDFAHYRPSTYNTYYMLRNHPEHAYMDDRSTPVVETAGTLYQRTFKQTLDSLDNWKSEMGMNPQWSNYKNTTIQHLLRLKPFTVDNVKIGGYRNIVNAASERHGPSWRMVVEMTPNGPNAWGVYPGSQTGNPGHPMYGHMIENWAEGEYYPLLFMSAPATNNERILNTLTLQPN